MPRIVFKGIQIKELKEISRELVNELSEIVNTPRDNFILEFSQNTYIFDGKEIETYPVVEVNWFRRSREIEQSVYRILENKIKGLGYGEAEVYFVELKEESYYY